MKKTFTKVIASVLCVLMLVMPFTSLALSAELDETITTSPVFTVEKVSETKTEFKLNIVLKSGSFSCADFTVTVDGLTCTSINLTDEAKAFRNEAEENGESFVYSSNNENGKSSIASSLSCSAATPLFTYTFTKSEATGVNGSDISFTVDTCYTTIDGVETDVTTDITVSSDIPAEHIHTETSDWVIVDSTCTAEGTKTLCCPECGVIVKTETIEKKAHTPKETRVEPTCTTPGSIISICEVCNEEISNTEIPETGHQNTETEHKDATCTEAGYDKVICKDCGTVVDEKEIPAINHINTTTEHKDATCSEEGYDKVICIDCKEVLSTTIIPKNENNHTSTRTEHKDATCTEAGYDKVVCEDCGTIVNETEIPAINHTNTTTEHKDATCSEEGYDKVICADCKEVLSTTVIAKLPHAETRTETINPTCTVPGSTKVYCVACNELLSEAPIPATGHGTTHLERKAPTCTEDGYVNTVCDLCNEVIKTDILPAGHSHVTEIKHETCTENGYISITCSICKDVISHIVLGAVGHDWTDWTVLTAATASTQGHEKRACRRCFINDERYTPIIYTPVESVTISNTDITLNYKKDAQLYAGLTPTDAEYSNDIEWTSSNEAVATVDENGLVTAIAVGTATITATSGEHSAECVVTVEYSILQWLIIIFLFGWIWY